MHQNPVWLFFLGIVALCVIGYTGWTLYDVYHYIRLTHRINVKHIDWSVYKESGDAFAPQANYQFTVEGVPYQNKTIWDTFYLNEWAAEEAIQKLSAQSWKAWVDPSNLNHSTLQKNFPTKEFLYMIILWLLLIYFISLGMYVKKRT